MVVAQPEPKKAPRKSKTAPAAAVVEGERTAGFKLFMGIIRWSFVFVPVLLFWWVLGTAMGGALSSGLAIAAVTTAVAFVLPLVVRMLVKRGAWAWWALGLAALGLGAILGLRPAEAARDIAHYGHWPTTAIAQAAGWAPDHFAVVAQGSGAEFLGHQLEAAVAPGTKTTATSLALGTTQTLKEAAALQQPAPPSKPESPEPGAAPKEDVVAPQEEASPGTEPAESAQ